MWVTLALMEKIVYACTQQQILCSVKRQIRLYHKNKITLGQNYEKIELGFDTFHA